LQNADKLETAFLAAANLADTWMLQTTCRRNPKTFMSAWGMGGTGGQTVWDFIAG